MKSNGNPPGFPPVPLKELAYQWTDDNGAIHVGTLARTKDGNHINRITSSKENAFLFKHSHTGELEWVPCHRLTFYPSDPIPDPS